MREITSRIALPRTQGWAQSLQGVLRFAARKPLGAVGVALTLGAIFTAVAAPVLAPQSPYVMEIGKSLAAPDGKYLLGTDIFGRDVLSRIIFGARVSTYVAFTAVAFSSITGSLIGVFSAYLGSKVDMYVQRLVDIMMTFPGLVLALAIVSVLGPTVENVIVAIAIVETPRVARITRSAAFSVVANDYIEAARAMGASSLRVVLRHVLPNCIAPLLVYSTSLLGGAILVEASLSFLGLGTPPPTASWGRMLSEQGRDYMERAPWLAIWPGLALTLTVFGFNILGDALRDILDPRLRR